MPAGRSGAFHGVRNGSGRGGGTGGLARLLNQAASIAASTADVEAAWQAALDLVCDSTGWPLGHIYTVDPDGATLVSSGIWHNDDPDRFGAFVAATAATSLRPGVGLPGRILASGEPAWIMDVRIDPNFARRKLAVASGIGAGFGFPIRSLRGVEGVMEFFAVTAVEPDGELLDLISHVGVQLGAVLDRARAQHALEASERRLRTLVESAPDALVVVDGTGTIVLANDQTEALTGYSRDALVGQPVEILVPEASRVDHERNRHRYARAPRRRAMGAGLELSLRRHDGTDVPVDISLSPIDGAEGELVAVALRDISARRAADEALRSSEAQLTEAQRLARVGSWSWEVGPDAVTWSPELCRIFGLDPDAGPPTFGGYLARVHPDDRARVSAVVQHTLATREPYEHGYRIVLPDGTLRRVHSRGQTTDGPDGAVVRLTGYCQDITDRWEAEDRRDRAQADLATHHRILEQIARGEPVDATLDALCREIESRYPDARCSVLLVDPVRHTLRHAAAPSLPEALRQAIDGLPVGVGIGACGTAAALRTDVVVEDALDDPLTAPFAALAAEHGLRSVWSHPLVSAAGEVLGTFAIYRPVPHRPAEAEMRTVRAAGHLAGLAIDRSRADKALTAAARVDPLTGLPNRAQFLEQLTEQLDDGRSRIAVMFLDLDRFKWINDSLGHPAGDRILVEVAGRLSKALGGRHVLARFGGDEFTILVVNATAPGLAVVSERLVDTFTEPFVLDGGEFFLSVSIGIAQNDHPADAYGLVRDADAAMYSAKESGRGRRAMFDERLRERALARVTLEAELRRAIARDEFVLYYQPVLDLASGEWAGAEALVRWQHPTRGLVGPDHFIPLAEETGLIVPLGLQIIDRTIRQAAAWAAAGRALRVAVNVSAVQLSDPMLRADFVAALQRHRLPPEQLILEVTETAIMEHLEAARDALEQLAATGVSVIIDDFGTGYSSIARLGELPVVGLKIDRLFTTRIAADGAEKVLGAITDLAHALDLQVVAEGIESEAARAAVAALGCDYGQGFHLARPMPPDQLLGLLADG